MSGGSWREAMYCVRGTVHHAHLLFLIVICHGCEFLSLTFSPPPIKGYGAAVKEGSLKAATRMVI
jgi:hypothetical protein